MDIKKRFGKGNKAPADNGMQPSLDNRKIMFFALDAILVVVFVLIIVVSVQKSKVSSPTDADGTQTDITAASTDETETTEDADLPEEAVGSANGLFLSAGEDSHSITWTFREAFEEDYYDFDELKEAVESEVLDFNSAMRAAAGEENADTVYLTLVSCEQKVTTTDGEEENCVEVSLLFSSVDAFVTYYNDYTNPEEEAYLFCGTISEAQAEGYVFEEVYENGGGDLAYFTEELMLEESVYVILTNLEMDLEIEDTVLCWAESVTEEEEVFHTTAGSQNTIIAAAE